MDNPVRTMMAVAAFFALVMSILGILFWRTQRTYAGSGRKAIANFLYALCLLLLTLRPVMPDWIGLVGANTGLAAAAILSLEATREYRGLRPRVFSAYAGGIVVVVAVVYFDYVLKNLNARVFAMSAFMGVVAILCSVTLLQEKRPARTLGVSVSGGMFAMTAAVLMARAIYFLLAPPLTDLFTPSWINGTFFVGCVLSIACCSIAWKSLIGERVLLDLEEAESRTRLANRGAAEATERANESLRRQAQLMNLPATLLQAQETERRLLARELHDNFGQTLAALSMEASALPKSSSEPDVISRRTRDLAKKIAGLATDVHRISQELHPALLDDLGVEAALKEECTSFSQRLGILIRFEAKGVPRSLPGDIALCLFRVAQESLHNIAEHAVAKEVFVRLAGGKAGIALVIEDFGNGFSVEHAKGTSSLGLIGMEERVRLVNGSLQIRSQRGEGTRVEVHVPLPETAY